MKNFLFLYAFLFLIISCGEQKNKKTVFKNLNPEQTGIHFSNNIIENDTMNYTTFPYMYMGGGISIGDINNDGLEDVFFTGNMTSNKLYLNKGNLQFEDISESSGTKGDKSWYTGTTMVDINNDGWLDIYVCVSGKTTPAKNQLFINNKDNTFTEMAALYGLDDSMTSIQSTFFDYDNDGDLDVFVANYPIVPVTMGNKYYKAKMLENKPEQSGHLYRNDGNKSFTDVTRKAGVQNFGLTLGLIASDINNDGWQDLYLSNDFNVPDYFYLNNGDGTFREISQQAMQHTSMFGMGIDIADFNNDTHLDLIQVDMTPSDYKRSKTNMASMSPSSFYEAVDMGLHYQYMQNSLQVNNGSQNGVPNFSEISRLAGIATTDWSWGSLFADFDNDGLKDILITNGMKRDVNNNDVNERTKETTFMSQEINYKQYPSTPIDNYIFKNNGDFNFSKMNTVWNLKYKGFSNGVAYSDLDNDGDLDILMNNLDDTASLFENKTELNEENNYIRIKLRGEKSNSFAHGAKVLIHKDQSIITQEISPTRGFQSSVSSTLHFGLGKTKAIDSIEIKWPNGNGQILHNISSNQLLVIDNKSETSNITVPAGTLFTDITKSIQHEYIHTEDSFPDFEFEPLLPHRNSRMGPGLTVGDVNNDGLEDFFIGNAKDKAGSLFIQDTQGNFIEQNGPWQKDSAFEDTGALLFDADNDGDLDLYVVNGGNDSKQPISYYQDRMYLNTKNGFIKTNDVLPSIISSGLCVQANDFDKDGDMDLFVGGRIIPGNYPYPAKSYILRNDSTRDTLKFIDISEEIFPQLNQLGLVTSAIWNDFDNDGLTDLIVTGEWMPIKFIKNDGKKFIDATIDIGLENAIGWWNNIESMDLDDDGDLDFLVGNLGLNYKYKTSHKKQFQIYANDFDENGTNDIVLSYEKDNKLVPLRGRECSSQQVPAIKRRFKTYEVFADASLKDIYGQKMLDNSLHYSATNFANSWIENKGNGNFKLQALPTRLQFSSINSFVNIHTNKQSKIISAGNLLNSEVETPRNDSNIGAVFSFDKHKNIHIEEASKTGLFLKGEVKQLKTISIGKNRSKAILVAKNNDKLQLLKLNQ